MKFDCQDTLQGKSRIDFELKICVQGRIHVTRSKKYVGTYFMMHCTSVVSQFFATSKSISRETW